MTENDSPVSFGESCISEIKRLKKLFLQPFLKFSDLTKGRLHYIISNRENIRKIALTKTVASFESLQRIGDGERPVLVEG